MPSLQIPDWLAFDSKGIDLGKPGVLRWTIPGRPIPYYSCSKVLGTSLRHYINNVEKLKSGRPYRMNNPDGFRNIHRWIAAAIAENGKQEVLCKAIENCADLEVYERKAYWQSL